MRVSADHWVLRCLAVLIVIAAAFLASSPAKADLFQLNVSGTIASSHDQTGLFGAGTGADTIAGTPFWASFSYETNAGTIVDAGPTSTLWYNFGSPRATALLNGREFVTTQSLFFYSPTLPGPSSFGVVAQDGGFIWLDPAQTTYQQTGTFIQLSGNNGVGSPSPSMLNLSNISTFGFTTNGFVVDTTVSSQTYFLNSSAIGTVTSFSLMQNGQVVAAPIPEPETYAMLLAGLGLLAGAARRRQARQRAAAVA